MRQQVVREQYRLRPLQVGVRERHNAAIALGLLHLPRFGRAMRHECSYLLERRKRPDGL